MFRHLSLAALFASASAYHSPVGFGDPTTLENPFTQNNIQASKGGYNALWGAGSASFFDGKTTPYGDQYFKSV